MVIISHLSTRTAEAQGIIENIRQRIAADKTRFEVDPVDHEKVREMIPANGFALVGQPTWESFGESDDPEDEDGIAHYTFEGWTGGTLNVEVTFDEGVVGSIVLRTHDEDLMAWVKLSFVRAAS